MNCKAWKVEQRLMEQVVFTIDKFIFRQKNYEKEDILLAALLLASKFEGDKSLYAKIGFFHR